MPENTGKIYLLFYMFIIIMVYIGCLSEGKQAKYEAEERLGFHGAGDTGIH